MKKALKRLAQFVRDFTPFVPLTWVIFWMSGTPEHVNNNILWCVLYFVGLSIIVGLLFYIGGIAAYGDAKFMEGWGDDDNVSLWNQIKRLGILLLILVFFTSYFV